jgi:hypothetical protein
MPRRLHYGAVAVSMADPPWLNRYDNNEHIGIDSDRQPNSEAPVCVANATAKANEPTLMFSLEMGAVSLADRGLADIA